MTIAGCKEMDPDWTNQDSFLVCEDDNDDGDGGHGRPLSVQPETETVGEDMDIDHEVKKNMKKDGPIARGVYSVFDGHGPT